MKTRFVDDDLWSVLRTRLARPHNRVLAAVSYVTDLPAGLGVGDLLVVDASHAALRAGVTNPAALRQCLKQELEVRSVPGLHAKVVLVDDDWLLVGSANWSRRSATRLREAGLITDGGEAIASARGFFRRLVRRAQRVDGPFVDAAEKIYRPPKLIAGEARKPSKAARPDSMCWLLACHDGAGDDAFAESQGEMMQSRRKHRSWNVDWTRFDRVSRPAREIREGDRVVFIFEEARTVRVLSPLPVLGVRRRGNRTYVWTEQPEDVFARGLSWRDGKRWLASLGIRATVHSLRAFPAAVRDDLEQSWKRAQRRR